MPLCGNWLFSTTVELGHRVARSPVHHASSRTSLPHFLRLTRSPSRWPLSTLCTSSASSPTLSSPRASSSPRELLSLPPAHLSPSFPGPPVLLSCCVLTSVPPVPVLCCSSLHHLRPSADPSATTSLGFGSDPACPHLLSRRAGGVGARVGSGTPTNTALHMGSADGRCSLQCTAK